MLPVGAIDRIAAAARTTPDLVALYLFGSQSTGGSNSGSDVDLGVLGRRPFALEDLVDLQMRLQEAAGSAVDLVDLRTAEAFLALDVIRGERLCCSDDVAADTFELFVMRRAGDLEPFERERRRVLAMTPIAATASRR